ncbi:terminase [Vibrio rotiferianus]|uniref:phage terminase small subunit n=1 Tax=Vibrio rotiferianus TaxID=190895 RepID=UPI001110F658|nr:phage terminase small subunit [Vibrio rotiferianus]TMX39749.1 terminase [Vibrio rotiferianus]TMX57854.1 terminase [Vibrio rotiferianus]TMX59147.1 terminase [Vibrio rotiferianus]
MASPLAKARQQIIEEQRYLQQRGDAVANPNSLHLLLAELETDLKVLKNYNRTDEKVEYKREVLVPKYREAVEAYLEGGDQFDNPLFAQMVIWLFDIEDLDTAIEWCGIAIERGLDTPERFKRDFATFCADEVLAWADRMAEKGHAIEPYFSQVFEKVRSEWSINEKLTAKWFKFAGLHLLRNDKGKPHAASIGDIEILKKARDLLTEAHEQYVAIGVGTMVDNIDQRIRALESGNNL